MRVFSSQNLVVVVAFVFIGLTNATPVQHATPCHGSKDNCTRAPNDSAPPSGHRRESRPAPTDTTSTRSTSTRNPYPPLVMNFKIIAIVVAAIALCLALVRICLLICNRSSRPSRNEPSHRHTATVRPQIITARAQFVKPDLPPAYAEATAYCELDTTKLPTYDELHNRQRTPEPTEQSTI